VRAVFNNCQLRSLEQLASAANVAATAGKRGHTADPRNGQTETAGRIHGGAFIRFSQRAPGRCGESRHTFPNPCRWTSFSFYLLSSTTTSAWIRPLVYDLLSHRMGWQLFCRPRAPHTGKSWNAPSMDGGSPVSWALTHRFSRWIRCRPEFSKDRLTFCLNAVVIALAAGTLVLLMNVRKSMNVHGFPRWAPFGSAVPDG